jgi:hypothetical protein
MLARMSLSTPGLFATIPNSVTAANRPRPVHRLRLTSGKLAGVLWLLDRRHSDHRSRIGAPTRSSGAGSVSTEPAQGRTHISRSAGTVGAGRFRCSEPGLALLRDVSRNRGRHPQTHPHCGRWAASVPAHSPLTEPAAITRSIGRYALAGQSKSPRRSGNHQNVSQQLPGLQ